MRIIACSLIALASLAQAAMAEDLNVSAAAGKRTLIGSFAVYDGFGCTQAGAPEASIARQPTNGKVEIVVSKRTSRTPRCGVIEFIAPMVYYTPKQGFRGADEVAVDYKFFAFNEGNEIATRRHTYRVTVK